MLDLFGIRAKAKTNVRALFPTHTFSRSGYAHNEIVQDG